MTLKEHYAKFKITTGPSLMKECFQMFSQVIMDSKRFENTTSLVMTGHYFKHCYVLSEFSLAKLNHS